MQYKIPQNVGIEDKIVGPLTLRQLIMVAVGFGLSYTLFAIISKIYELNIIEYVIIALPLLLSAAFALVRVNDISLAKFMLLFMEFAIKPKQRVWDHRGIESVVSPDIVDTKAKAGLPAENVAAEKAKKAAGLKDLTRMLDSGGFEHLEEKAHRDIDSVEDDDLMTQAYFGNKTNETENMYWRTKDSHMKMLDLFARMPVASLKAGTKEAAVAREEIKKVKEEVAQKKEVTVPQRTKPAPFPAARQKPMDTAQKEGAPTELKKPAPAATGAQKTAQPQSPVRPAQPSAVQPPRPAAPQQKQAAVTGQTKKEVPPVAQKQVVQPTIQRPAPTPSKQPAAEQTGQKEPKKEQITSPTPKERQQTARPAKPAPTPTVPPKTMKDQVKPAKTEGLPEKKTEAALQNIQPTQQQPPQKQEAGKAVAPTKPQIEEATKKEDQPKKTGYFPQIIPKKTDAGKVSGELDIRDLQRGEIEINLD